MTDGLNETQTKILTWVVYALLTVLTTVVGWQQIKLTNLSSEFVRLERYKTDENRIQQYLCRIETTLNEIQKDIRK